MTIKKFQSLDYHQKLRVVYFQGNELDFKISKTGNLQSYTCYAVANFFVELIFDYRLKKITSIAPFEDGKSLEHFTENRLGRLF